MFSIMRKRAYLYAAFIGLFLNLSACAKEEKQNIRALTSMNELEKVFPHSGEKLIGFDLYADWCLPCKILSPMLEEIAGEHRDEVTFYKINVDKTPDLAYAFGVSGIPYVVFVKNGKPVKVAAGLRSKEDYVRIIKQYAKAEITESTISANGKIVDGVRVIPLEPNAVLEDIYVYRGEEVNLVMRNLPYDVSIHIPEFKISRDGKKGESLEIQFKAEKKGVYDVFCNGDCLVGNGEKHGRIVVLQFKSEGKSQFIEATAKQAKKLLEETKPLLLDVRTPSEYYAGHIHGAKLIPLSQLEQRLPEIKNYKNKDILVYCRSGNRSTVAAQILLQNGFKKITNLRHGIIEWKSSGY